MAPVTESCVSVSLHISGEPEAVHPGVMVSVIAYFAYCTAIVSVLDVFFRIITPKLPAAYDTPLAGSVSDGAQEAGSIASPFGCATLVSEQSDPAIVILLPAVQFG